MSDDRFDSFLDEALADYNRPAEAPREDMWRRIEGELDRRRGQAGVFRRDRFRGWPLWATGIAAALVVGIALGRLGTGTTTSPAPAAGAPSNVAAGDSAGTGAAASGSRPAAGGAAAPRTSGPRPAAPLDDRPRQAEQRVATARMEQAGARSGNDDVAPLPTLAGVSAAGRSGSAVSPAYRLAALQTFGQAEALLTAVRTAPSDSLDYARLSDWARDVLGTTRLLLDSPAGQDPTMGRLLSDLELVLVQVAGLADDRETGRELIQGALQRRDVLPRLRAAVPAGDVAGT